MTSILEKWEKWNVIPARDTEKHPISNWKKYQTEIYAKEKLKEHNGNIGVVTGKISNNLWIIDLDFKKGCKDKFSQIWEEFSEKHPNLSKTFIEESPNGFHPMYYVDDKDFETSTANNKNAGYYRKKSGKNKGKIEFKSITYTKYRNYLQGFDTRGEGGFLIIAPSKFNGITYKPYNNREILTITKEEHDKIKNFFLLEKPIRVRKGWVEIFNGKIDVHDQIALAKEKFDPKEYPDDEKEPKENAIWKGLYLEMIYNHGTKPEDLFEGLQELQPAFDRSKSIEQLPSLWKDVQDKVKPFTNVKMKKYFPQFDFKQQQKKNEKTIKIKPKREIKKLTPQEIALVEEWLNHPEKKRFEFLDEIINFKIKGKESQKLALHIFFLLLGDVLSKNLISKIDFHGDPSMGKSYITDAVVDLFPEENYIKMTNASPKALIYNSEFDEHIKFIYLRELVKKNTEMVELSKALYDGDINYLVTHFEIMDVEEFRRKRTGFITTYSFEFTQRDANERAWIFIPDTSDKQNRVIINFRLSRRARRIEYDFKEDKLKVKIEFLKNVIRYLRDQVNPTIEMPFALNLKEIFEKNTNSRVRRDVDKLPDIIEIIALFNQKHRKVFEFGKNKYLFAEYNDLCRALDFGLDRFITISQNLDKNKTDILKHMKIDNSEITDYDLSNDNLFTITQIYNYLKEEGDCPCKDTVKNKMTSLSKDGYLEKIEGGKGKAFLFRQIKTPEDIAFNPENLKEEINNRVEQDWIFWNNKTPEILDFDNNKIEFEAKKFQKEEKEDLDNFEKIFGKEEGSEV